MDAFLEALREWLGTLPFASLTRALFVFVASLLVAKLLGRALTRWLGSVNEPRAVLLRRILSYGVVSLGVVTALREIGFDLSVLLGAAGILTVAVGFASQTSASNLISGLFLIGERAFDVGDTIRVGTTTGEVLSVDLLSVKLRTFDNLFVRVPNETLIKSEFTNLSRFEIRRLDLQVRIGYGAELEHVRSVLEEEVMKDPRVLLEPEHLFVAEDFEATGVLLRYSVWVRRQDYAATRSALQIETRRALDAAAVALPGSRWIAD